MYMYMYIILCEDVHQTVALRARLVTNSVRVYRLILLLPPQFPGACNLSTVRQIPNVVLFTRF